MPALPGERSVPVITVPQIVSRTPSPIGLIPGSNVKQILSDALLSFSPLATLVGAESNRALAHRVTNFKQSLVVSLAPIGALSMMATACKGANLPGLKDMLGVGDEDINDAARAIGCSTLIGDVMPSMDKHGGVIPAAKGESLENAASAIVRLAWNTGDRRTGDRTGERRTGERRTGEREAAERMLDFAALRRVVTMFTAGTISGRVVWQLDSKQASEEKTERVREALRMSEIGSGFGVFEAMDDLKDGKGMVELHWPSPAMPMETNPIVIYLYGGFFALSFLSVAILAASPLLSWQSPIASTLLVGGQAFLVLGHVAVRSMVISQRKTLKIPIPKTGLGQHWMMINKTRFPSALARRPYSFSPLFPDHVTLSQHHSLNSNFVVTWHTLLTLVALVAGFIAFYVGGKSSDIKTVLIYIGLFILANVLKGPVVLYANKPEYQCLKAFEHKKKLAMPSSKMEPVIPVPAPQSGKPFLEIIIT
jgi:hypothetical protein